MLPLLLGPLGQGPFYCRFLARDKRKGDSAGIPFCVPSATNFPLLWKLFRHLSFPCFISASLIGPRCPYGNAIKQWVHQQLISRNFPARCDSAAHWHGNGGWQTSCREENNLRKWRSRWRGPSWSKISLHCCPKTQKKKRKKHARVGKRIGKNLSGSGTNKSWGTYTGKWFTNQNWLGFLFDRCTVSNIDAEPHICPWEEIQPALLWLALHTQGNLNKSWSYITVARQ